jgi:hypothetical protein
MSKEVLNKYWKWLLARDNVLNVALGNKITKGVDTGVPAIVVYVSKKLPAGQLAAGHLIPPALENVPTDVVELAPKTWQAGKTTVSQLHPEDQRRLLGIRDRPAPKAIRRIHPEVGTASGHSNWIPWASPVQNQANCGSCTSFGNIGIWEIVIRIKRNNQADPIKLSEAHLFFCAGGTCDGGCTVDAILNQALNGVCLESCLPYQDHDQACGAGICANWWENAEKLSAWNIITDPDEIKSLLDREPLNATMAVHQSFFNYTGGTYRNLGPQDPIVGYHDIGCLGYDDPANWRAIRNSWGIGWAPDCVIDGEPRPGYCLIDAGELDPQMYELVPDGPVPAPSPSPNHGCLPFGFMLRYFRRGKK